MVEEGEIDEDLFSAGMEHIYHHLNTAWNARNLSDELFYDGNFHDLRKFPDDIIAEFRDAAKH